MAMDLYSDKVELAVSGKRMWKAAFEESDQVLPRSAPGVVDRVEIVGGTGKYEVGSIRIIHFTRGYAEKLREEKHPDRLVLFTKEKVLEMDRGSLSARIDVIEGGFVGVLVKRYSGSFRIEETGPESSVLHYSFEYEALSEAHGQHVPAALRDAVPKGFLNIQAFLLSNPSSFC